jgi:hypothetical protein
MYLTMPGDTDQSWNSFSTYTTAGSYVKDVNAIKFTVYVYKIQPSATSNLDTTLACDDQ